jgi:hypothetical protein
MYSSAHRTRFNQCQRKRKWHIWNACDVSFSNELSITKFHDDTPIRVSRRGYGYVSRIRTRIRATMEVLVGHATIRRTMERTIFFTNVRNSGVPQKSAYYIATCPDPPAGPGGLAHSRVFPPALPQESWTTTVWVGALRTSWGRWPNTHGVCMAHGCQPLHLLAALCPLPIPVESTGGPELSS